MEQPLLSINLHEFVEALVLRLSQELCKCMQKDEPPLPDDLLSPKKVAEIFGVSLQTINNWRKDGLIKAYYMGKRKVYYRRSEVEQVYLKTSKNK